MHKEKIKKSKTYIRDGRSPMPKSELTSRVMSSIKGKDTKPELILRKALRKSDLVGYRLHWKKAPGSPDICYPGRKIAIFVNGCYWHRCPLCNRPLPKTNTDFWEQKFTRNIERDRLKVQQLEEKNWAVLTIWECEIRKDLPKQVLKVQKLLNRFG